MLTKALEHPRQSIRSPQWTNIGKCIVMGVDVKSEYPTSSYLFRCLESPAGDPVAAKVAITCQIDCSTKLKVISGFICDLSTALKDVNTTKAAQLLRPLQNRRIFPIIDRPGTGKYDGFDQLMDSKDTSWYIADQPNVRGSFLGKLPLLALPVEHVSSIRELLSVLRLDDRILSKLARPSTQPRGRVITHWSYMALLRERAPFLKA